MPCCNAVSRGASVFCSKRAGAGRYIQEIWALHRDLCLLKIFKLRFNKACLLLIFDTCSDQSRSCILGWVGNCLGICFFSLGIFFWISGSHHFLPHAICSILELETAISTVCATVLSSNLSFSIVFPPFPTVFATVCSMFCPFSMLFAAFLSWNLHFHRMCNILQLHSSQYLQDFGAEG